MNVEKVKNPSRGILLVILGFLAFSIMSGFIKACSSAGFSTQEIMFFQNICALIVLMPWILRGGRSGLVPKNKVLVISRAILGLSSMYLFFLAVRLVPLVNAVLLQNTVPLFVPIITFLIFKKKITSKAFATIIVGFIGIVLVLNPGRGFLRPGDLVALSAGFLSAVVTIILGRLEDKYESVPTIMLYYLIITIFITGAWSISAWKTPSGIVWFYLAASGILFAAFQVLLILSLKHASAVIIAPFAYLSVVFSGIIDWVVWKQVPDLITVLGVGVVVAGAVFSVIQQTKNR